MLTSPPPRRVNACGIGVAVAAVSLFAVGMHLYIGFVLPLQRNEAAVSFCSIRVCKPSLRAASILRSELGLVPPPPSPPDELASELAQRKQHAMQGAWGAPLIGGFAAGGASSSHTNPEDLASPDEPESCGEAMELLQREGGVVALEIDLLAYNPTIISLAALGGSIGYIYLSIYPSIHLCIYASMYVCM